MKKLAKSLVKSLPPAKIYREDIEDIFNVFKEVSSEIKIEADGFEFDNLDELFSYTRDKINSLHLSIRNPRVYIEFKPDSISLYSMNDTSVEVGLFEKIKSIVKKHRNWTFSLITNPFLFGICAGTGFYPILSYLKTNELQYLIEFMFILLLCSFWFFYGFIIHPKKHSQIFLRYKKEDISFLEKNRDNIILSTIFLLLSVVIAYLLK